MHRHLIQVSRQIEADIALPWTQWRQLTAELCDAAVDAGGEVVNVHDIQNGRYQTTGVVIAVDSDEDLEVNVPLQEELWMAALLYGYEQIECVLVAPNFR